MQELIELFDEYDTKPHFIEGTLHMAFCSIKINNFVSHTNNSQKFYNEFFRKITPYINFKNCFQHVLGCFQISFTFSKRVNLFSEKILNTVLRNLSKYLISFSKGVQIVWFFFPIELDSEGVLNWYRSVPESSYFILYEFLNLLIFPEIICSNQTWMLESFSHACLFI